MIDADNFDKDAAVYLYIRLMNGDELMALLDYDDDNTIGVVFPMQILSRQEKSPNGFTEVISVAPYAKYLAQRRICLQKSHILVYDELHDKLVDYYLKYLYHFELANPDHKFPRESDDDRFDAYYDKLSESSEMKKKEQDFNQSMINSVSANAETSAKAENDNSLESSRFFIDGNETLN